MKTIKIAILFSGNGSNLENLVTFFRNKENLKYLKVQPIFSIAICNNKNAFGLNRCENLKIDSIVIPHTNKTREEFDLAVETQLKKHKIDLVILAGFMRILTPEFTKKFKIINIHPSFLPLHKGANAIKDSFYGNENFGGVSVHWVNENLDSGEIILQEKIEKLKNENLENFESRIHELEYKLYPQAILKVLNRI